VSQEKESAEMKKLLIVLLGGLLMLSGCASDFRSRTAIMEVNNQKLSLYVAGKTGPYSDDMAIYVNNQKIAEGAITSSLPSTNFSGVYNGINIDAECSVFATGGLNMMHKCLLFLNGKKSDELTF